MLLLLGIFLSQIYQFWVFIIDLFKPKLALDNPTISIFYANNNSWILASADKLPRIDESHVSREGFIEKYEAPGLPVVITGCSKAWTAEIKWNKVVSQ